MGKIIDMDGKSKTILKQSRKGAKESQREDDDSEPKYSQNPIFQGQGFSLYCKGMSLPAVVDALRPEWPEVSLRTVQRIAKDMGWEKSRVVYMKLHTDAQASAEGLVPEVVMTLQKIRAQMEGRVLVKPADIFAYRALVEDLLWYTGKHPKLKDTTPLAVSNDSDIAALLEAIAEDDVVGGAWKKRRPHIEKAFKEKLAAKETEKTKKGQKAKA